MCVTDNRQANIRLVTTWGGDGLLYRVTEEPFAFGRPGNPKRYSPGSGPHGGGGACVRAFEAAAARARAPPRPASRSGRCGRGGGGGGGALRRSEAAVGCHGPAAR